MQPTQANTLSSGMPVGIRSHHAPRFQTQPVMIPMPVQMARLVEQKVAYDDLQRRRKAMPEDTLLNYNFLDKAIHQARTVFVTVPKTLARGLQGAPDFTFSEMMLNAKVPYYLGGLFLTLSPFLGGNRLEGVRQGVAVGLYLLGIAGTNAVVNTLYRLRYGVDLGMMYRSKSGQVESVFGSADFPRFDLLKSRHYAVMARKMGIPKDIYEQDGAVREQLRKIIVSSRTLKLVVGTLASAIGAGYLARTDGWWSVASTVKAIDKLWSTSRVGFLTKLGRSASMLGSALKKPLVEKLTTSGVPLWRQGVVWGGLAVGLFTLGYSLTNRLVRKDYAHGVAAYRPASPAPRYGTLDGGGYL